MTILLIEDDLIEAMKMRRTLAKSEVPHELIVAREGEEAFEVLRSGAPLPDIILLDLNMPRMNGLEFLTLLKKDKGLCYLPAIVLTTSENRTDLLTAYRLGIAGYLLKPLIYSEYENKIFSLLHYWNYNELVKG